MEVAISVVAAAVAVVSLGVSIWSAMRSHSQAERSQRDSYAERMRDWADDTIEIVVSVRWLCLADCPPATFDAERHDRLGRLSAQIEKGRWFFPNYDEELFGKGKNPAYRGHRQRVLDELIAIFDCVEKAEWSQRSLCDSKVLRHQKSFVSDVQLRLGPRQRDHTYEDYVRAMGLAARERQAP